MNKFSEKDWKIFRSKIAGWQEAYMDKLNKEYIEIQKYAFRKYKIKYYVEMESHLKNFGHWRKE